MHEKQNGSVQQTFCVCGNQNVESVILMSMGLFLLVLRFAFNFSSLAIFYIILFIYNYDHELNGEYPS